MIKDLEKDLVQKLRYEMKPDSGLYLIMYELRTGMILEVSESLQTDFGLRPGMFHNQSSNSPSMQLICPELTDLSKLSFMRGKGGDTITFDTTPLKDTNYWIGVQEEEYEMEKGPEEEESCLLEPKSKPDLQISHSQLASNVFHRANCMAWVCFSQIIEKREFVCLRFIQLKSDTDEENQLENIESSTNSFLKPLDDGEGGNDAESDEDLAKIKASRTMVQNSSTDKSISAMRWTISIAALAYLGIAIYVKLQSTNDQEIISKLASLQVVLSERNFLLTDTAILSRLHEMSVNGAIDSYDSVVIASRKLAAFNMTKRLIDKELDQNQVYSLFGNIHEGDTKKYSFRSLSRFNDYSTINLRFNDGVMSLATDLKFSQDGSNVNFYRNYSGTIPSSRLAALRFYLNTPGVFNEGGSDLRIQMSDHFRKELNAIYLKHWMILVGQTVLLAVLAAILLRFVFQVHAANRDVIKLFSMIELKEILTLRHNCLKFIKDNLLHFLDSKEKNSLLNDEITDRKIIAVDKPQWIKEETPRNKLTERETGRQLLHQSKESESSALKKARIPSVLNKKVKANLNNPKRKSSKSKKEPDYSKANDQDRDTLRPQGSKQSDQVQRSSAYLENEIELRLENSTKRIEESEMGTTNVYPLMKSDPKLDSNPEKESLKDTLREEAKVQKIRKLNHAGSQSIVMSKRIEITRLNKELNSKELTPGRHKKLSDEEEAHRRGKFRRSRSSYKKNLILWTTVVCFLLVLGFALTMLPVPVMTTSAESVIDFMDQIVEFSSDIKLIYFVFIESMVNRKDILYNDRMIFAELMTKISNSNNYISENIGDVPSDFSSFGAGLKDLLFKNMCEVLLLPKHGISNCENDTVLKSGLELVNMHVVSEAQNQLIQFRQANFNQQMISDYIRTNFLTLNQYVTFSRLAYEEILKSYSKSMEEAMAKYAIVNTCLLLFWLVVILALASVALFKYLESLRLEIWKTRSMLNMIPNEVINSNSALKDVFLGRAAIRDLN